MEKQKKEKFRIHSNVMDDKPSRVSATEEYISPSSDSTISNSNPTDGQNNYVEQQQPSFQADANSQYVSWMDKTFNEHGIIQHDQPNAESPRVYVSENAVDENAYSDPSIHFVTNQSTGEITIDPYPTNPAQFTNSTELHTIQDNNGSNLHYSPSSHEAASSGRYIFKTEDHYTDESILNTEKITLGTSNPHNSSILTMEEGRGNEHFRYVDDNSQSISTDAQGKIRVEGQSDVKYHYVGAEDGDKALQDASDFLQSRGYNVESLTPDELDAVVNSGTFHDQFLTSHELKVLKSYKGEIDEVAAREVKSEDTHYKELPNKENRHGNLISKDEPLLDKKNNLSKGNITPKTVIRKTKDGFVVEEAPIADSPWQNDVLNKIIPLNKVTDVNDASIQDLKIDTKDKTLTEKISVGSEGNTVSGKPSKIREDGPIKLKAKNSYGIGDSNEIVLKSKKGQTAGTRNNSTIFAGKNQPINKSGKFPKNTANASGKTILQKALSVGLAGGVCVGAIGGTQMMMNSTFMWAPNAAHYYTDGSPQTGIEEEENKEAIRNGTADYFEYTSSDGTTEKLLITQAAVNSMAELQSSFEDTSFDSDDFSDLECIEIIENGMLVNASKLSGKNYMEYTGSYIATGVPLNNEEPSKVVQIKPKFEAVPIQQRGDVRIEVKYFNDKSASIRYYYPNSTSNVVQYFGNLSFEKEGAYIAGWATQKDSSEIVFERYQKLDKNTMQSLLNLSNNGEDPILLYPVWVDENISTKTVDIGVVTKEEIEGKLSKVFQETDLAVQYAYVDEGGNVQYTVENTDTTYTYSRDELFKAILAMATVATENNVASPETYIKYCERLLAQAITGYKGYSVSFSTKEIPNSMGTEYGITWIDNGITYAANGAKLTCNVTIFVNPSIESMMASDKTTSDWFKEAGLVASTFEGWTEENKEWARSYMTLSVDDFVEFFQVAFPPQAVYMSGYDNASVIFNILISHGYSPAAALGILGNLMQESGLDPTAFNSIGMVGIMQTFQNRLDNFAKLQGESWPNVSLTTQVEFIIYECEQTYNYTSSYSYGSSYLDDYVDEYGLDYCYMPIGDFKELTDIERATVAFCASYEKPQLWEANMKQRIKYAFEFAERIVYGNSSGAQGYISWAVSIAEDDSHGYSMARRTGPDYDCSSFVYYALLNGGYEQIKTYYSYPFTVDYIASTLTDMGFTIIPYSYDSLVAGDILISSGDEHTEIYIGDDKLVGAHGCQPSESHPGRSPMPGDQDGTELSVCSFFDLEEQPWVTIVRPPMGSGSGGSTQNGILQSNHHVSFYSQYNHAGEEDYSNSSERYNSGILCEGQAATADPDLPIGTVIYVVTRGTGISSAANGKYYIITDVIDKDKATYNSDYIIRLFHEVVESNTENMKSPYGSSTTAKVYKVESDVSWDDYVTNYGG